VLDDIFQALPFDELHHHERTPIVDLIDVFHAHGVGVLQLAREGGFLAEALHERQIARQLLVDHLQKYHILGKLGQGGMATVYRRSLVP